MVWAGTGPQQLRLDFSFLFHEFASHNLFILESAWVSSTHIIQQSLNVFIIGILKFLSFAFSYIEFLKTYCGRVNRFLWKYIVLTVMFMVLIWCVHSF